MLFLNTFYHIFCNLLYKLSRDASSTKLEISQEFMQHENDEQKRFSRDQFFSANAVLY